MTFSDRENDGRAADVAASTDGATIYVCITCRGPDGLVRDPLPGAMLAAATAQAAEGTGIRVRPPASRRGADRARARPDPGR